MIAIVFLAAAALPPLQDPWNHWRYERRIDTRARTAPVSFVVPPSLYVRAQTNLADVRILSENREVPFAIVTPAPRPDIAWIDGRIQDTGFVPHAYSQAVADFGTVAAPIETLEIQTPERSFATQATVEASDDDRTWRIVKAGAPIYDYARDGLDTNLRVRIAPTTSRLIRVRVERAPFTISGIRAAETLSEPTPRTRYNVTAKRIPSDNPKVSVYMLDGVDEVPFDRVEIYSTTPRYSRLARLEFNDGSGWEPLAQTQLVHAPLRDERAFAFDEVQLRRWRLIIENGNNEPLQAVRVYAFGAPRRVVFDAIAGRSYRLIYGNPLAEVPTYDYADTHEGSLHHTLDVALDEPQSNVPPPAPPPHRAWSEDHPWVLWGAMGLAACAVSLLALRALRSEERA